MRTSASFAALVTLMAVAGTSAAPIGATPGSSTRAVAGARGHQRSRSVVPVSDFKPTGPDVVHTTGTPGDKCGECGGDETKISIEGVQPLKDVVNTVGSLDKDLLGKVHVDNGMTPLGGGIHIDTNLDIGNKSQSQPQPQPQPQPEGHGNSSPDKTRVPDVDVHVDANIGDNKPQGQSPDSSSHPSGPQGQPDDCPDPSKDRHDGGLEVAAAVQVGTEGGKKDLDPVKETKPLVNSTPQKLDGSTQELEATVKAGANLALGDVQKVEDKAMSVGNGAHLAAGVDIGSGGDASKNVGGPYKPALSAVQEGVEGVDHLVKDLGKGVVTIGQGQKDQKPAEDCEDILAVKSVHGNPSISTSVVRRSSSRILLESA